MNNFSILNNKIQLYADKIFTFMQIKKSATSGKDANYQTAISGETHDWSAHRSTLLIAW